MVSTGRSTFSNRLALRVPCGLDRGQMEAYRRLLEERLNAAADAAMRWANGGPKPQAGRALPAAA